MELLKMKNLSLRFYQSDYDFLKEQSHANNWTIARTIVVMCQIHELFHHYFTLKEGSLRERKARPPELKGSGKVKSVNYRFQGHNAVDWLRCLIDDERAIMGNRDKQPVILHHLLRQFAYFQLNKIEIVQWYESYKPERLDMFRQNGYYYENNNTLRH